MFEEKPHHSSIARETSLHAAGFHICNCACRDGHDLNAEPSCSNIRISVEEMQWLFLARKAISAVRRDLEISSSPHLPFLPKNGHFNIHR